MRPDSPKGRGEHRRPGSQTLKQQNVAQTSWKTSWMPGTCPKAFGSMKN